MDKPAYKSLVLKVNGKLKTSPAYRATLLPIRWAQVETALTFLHFVCTSCYITCRRFRSFYGESMGKYGQFRGQLLTTNNFAKLFVCQLIVVAYRATLLFRLCGLRGTLGKSQEITPTLQLVIQAQRQ